MQSHLKHWEEFTIDKVTVIDSVMGSGKTTWAFQYMNEAPEQKRFIFITPFLDQIARCKKEVTTRQFIEPDNDNEKGRKMFDLKRLIVRGENIATTHSLFRDADDELIDLLTGGGYTLILDEAMDVVEKVKIGMQDVRGAIKAEYIRIEGNRVLWIDEDYTDSRYSDIKRLAKAGNLFIYREKFIVWTFPPRVFASFEEVYSMTYLFDGQLQRYYFDMHGIDYEYKAVKMDSDGRCELIAYDRKNERREDLIKLIDLYDGKLNDIGMQSNALSSSWLDKADGDILTKIKKGVYTYLYNQCRAKKADALWTTLKDTKSHIIPRGYKDCFLPVNARASDDYKKTFALAYVYNRYMNPESRAFFQENGVTVNEDALAVSDLLQWIWRSRIRNGQPVNLYLPSSRMRALLKAWSRYEI